MFKKEFRERQEYLKQNGPRTNFSFTNENYFPLKVEYIDLFQQPIKYDSSNPFVEMKTLEFSISNVTIDDSWNGFFS